MNLSRIQKLSLAIFIYPLLLYSTLLDLPYNLISFTQAQNIIEVDYGNPPVVPGAPVFTVENMLPGDEQFRDITVKNVSDTPQPVFMQAIKTDEEKSFSEILDVEITEGSSMFYGPKKLNSLFNESGPDGIFLGTFAPDEEKTFRVKVKFPSSAGNEWQLAMVEFDLIIGVNTDSNLVINEVFYNVDDIHGKDSPKERGVDATIENNAPGSVNIIDLKVRNKCVLIQKNNAEININVDSDANSGESTSFFGNIFTGAATTFTKIVTFVNINVGSCDEIKKNQNHEWIEIFNPGISDVSLQNWTLTDNSGAEISIDDNVHIPAGGFALITKDNDTWSFWEEDGDAVKIELGSDIGDGLDNPGDHIILKNPDGDEIDFVAWGDDTFEWNPAVPGASSGNSIERLSPGFDTNNPSDWQERTPPTPGE